MRRRDRVEAIAGGLSVFTVTEKGHGLGKRLEEALGARVHEPAMLKDGGLKREVKKAFASCRPIIFISATGIAVRTIAPFLKGKDKDPAVVVVDDNGRFAISLVSGHLGGANRLAREIAALLGAMPVVTTATDGAGLPSAEDIAHFTSSAVEDVKKIKKVNSAIIRGAAVAVIDTDPSRIEALEKEFGKSGVFTFMRSFPKRAHEACVFISSTGRVPEDKSDRTLVLRPREVVLGVGCGRGASLREISEAVRVTLSEKNISPLSVRNLASIDIKQEERGLKAFARKAGLRIEFFSPGELKQIKAPSGASEFVKEMTGTGAVAEPAALLSSGARKIWIRKKKFGRVTVAAALAPFTS